MMRLRLHLHGFSGFGENGRLAQQWHSSDRHADRRQKTTVSIGASLAAWHVSK
jgi:hypothetical protein